MVYKIFVSPKAEDSVVERFAYKETDQKTRCGKISIYSRICLVEGLSIWTIIQKIGLTGQITFNV